MRIHPHNVDSLPLISSPALWTLLTPLLDLIGAGEDAAGLEHAPVVAALPVALRLIAASLAEGSCFGATSRRAAALLLSSVGHAFSGVLATSSCHLCDRAIALTLRLVVCSEAAGESSMSGSTPVSYGNAHFARSAIEDCMHAFVRGASSAQLRCVLSRMRVL